MLAKLTQKLFCAGVAVGAGWQVLVALINVSCYYIFGLPVSALLGYKYNYGVYGIWSGLLLGCFMQTLFLSCLIVRTNWQKEVIHEHKHIVVNQ